MTPYNSAVARRAFFSLLLTDSRRWEVTSQCYAGASREGVADFFRQFTGRRNEDLFTVCTRPRPSHIDDVVAARKQHFEELRALVVQCSYSENV